MKRQMQYLSLKVREAFQDKVSTAEENQEIWAVLGMLVRHHEVNLGDLSTEFLKVVEEQNIRSYLDLAKRVADPLKYDQPALYWSNALVASFLKKFPFGKVAGLDPEAEARRRSEIAERRCRIANKRIAYWSKRWYRRKSRDPYLCGIFHDARLKIQRWLGPVDLNEVYSHARHGPGGALGCGRPYSTAYFKYVAEEGYTVSARCEPYAEAAILSDPLWRRALEGENPQFEIPAPETSREDLGIAPRSVDDYEEYLVADDGEELTEDQRDDVTDLLEEDLRRKRQERMASTLAKVRQRLTGANYNRVTYVPKTAQTHRAIAIEPLINVYLQLGVGSVLKRRLSAAGCDLRSQVRNQQLAALGSTDAVADFLRPATMDLEMASDTLCIELVRELLPPDWFDLLSDLRSPFGLREDGSVVKWAKFSSMGNGFTFELESLIFYALSLATVEKYHGDGEYVSVFGDDIVVPHYWYPMVREVLQFAGFRTNREKTFVAGPFRESCGKDFFKGTAVRPFFLKRRIKSRKDQIFLRNSLLLFAEEMGDLGYHQASDFVHGRLPGVIKRNLLGPRTEDLEGHLHVSWDLATSSPFVTWNRELQCWSYPTCRYKVRGWKQKPSTPYLYLQFMEGVKSNDGFESDREPPASSKARVVLSGTGHVQFTFGLSYRWDISAVRPSHRTLSDYLLKSEDQAVENLASAMLASVDTEV